MKKVLITDDSKMMRDRIKIIIEKFGDVALYDAANGDEAVTLYKEHKPYLMTLDISMPEKNGIEVLKEILDFDSKANVVIISAVAQKQMMIQALKIGAKDFIPKPFVEEEATKIIKDYM